MADQRAPGNRQGEIRRANSSDLQSGREAGDQPEAVAEEVTEEFIAEIRASLERHSGPLPHPQLLAQYRAIDPKASDWIFAAATKEQENRHWCDQEPLRTAARAQRFAFIIAVIVIITGGLLIYFDKSAEGLATILVPLASILGIFIYREATGSEEREGSGE